MLKKSYKILEVFTKNPTQSYLFTDIKEGTGSKSESYTYGSLTSFVNEGIITKEKRGGLAIYKMAKTPKAISYFSAVAEYVAWNSNIPSIQELISKIEVPFFTLLVVGSYAKNEQTSESDLDVVILVPNDAKKLHAELQLFCELNIPEIHLHVFTNEEFMQMLLDKKNNFGKEAVKNNLIFRGAEAYYKIIFEAMKNGFTC